MKIVVPGGSGDVGTVQWAREFDGADVVINLAGRNVNGRYNDAHRRAAGYWIWAPSRCEPRQS